MVAKIFWIFHKPAGESPHPGPAPDESAGRIRMAGGTCTDILERTTVVLWTAAGSSPIPHDRARPRKPLGNPWTSRAESRRCGFRRSLRAPPVPITTGRLQDTVQRQAGDARPGIYPVCVAPMRTTGGLLRIVRRTDRGQLGVQGASGNAQHARGRRHVLARLIDGIQDRPLLQIRQPAQAQ